MEKVSDTGGQIVYRHGNRFGLLFVILIPAAIVGKIWLDIDWLAVLVLTFMGLVMLFVAGMREQILIDVIARTITCEESYLGHVIRRELIPFDRVTGLSITPHYQRDDKGRGPAYQVGFRMTLDWNAEWGGGGRMLTTFEDEGSALREAAELARQMGTRVTGAAASAA